MGDRPIKDWKPVEVVEEVLENRSTARNTSGKKTIRDNVESIEIKELNGQNYWYYEHTTQTSPNINGVNKKNFRHTLSVSTVRLGLNNNRPYIYTLNVTSPEILWPDI